MSTTYDLACPEMGIKLWVGQSNYVYSARENIEKLARFLHATKGKPLFFVSEHIDTVVTEDDIFNCKYFEDSL